MKNLFLGRWKITNSEQWDPEMLNMDGDAAIEIEKEGFGFLNFCAVEVDIDYHFSNEGNNKLIFSFSGKDNRDPVNGRGWLQLQNDTLKIQIYFHRGMESWFEAERA